MTAAPRTIAAVKYVVLVPDGCADEPNAELGGRTPLQAAAMPHLAAMAARSEVGRAATPRPPPGSDVGNMAIGYDPGEYHTGRPSKPRRWASIGETRSFRCNTSPSTPPARWSFAAGHITSEQSHPIVAALDARSVAGAMARFIGGQYRHLRSDAGACRRTTHRSAGRPSALRPGSYSLGTSRPVVRRAATDRLGGDADLVVGSGCRR
jgi:2,3-bisphosphoglycerate-independent phosphoglycerate mutase